MSLKDFGHTAAVLSIGDEVVEGRVVNENASWLCGQLMRRGIWPRLVVAVPDDEQLIVQLLRLARDSTDVVVVTGGMGFTPDDITKRAVARACMRDLVVHRDVQIALTRSLHWAGPDVVESLATFPVDSHPILSGCGGVPGFSIADLHVLPGAPREMREMFSSIRLPEAESRIYTVSLVCETTEDSINHVLGKFEARFDDVRLGSYADYETAQPHVGLVLAARSRTAVHDAKRWLCQALPEAIEDSAV